MLYKIESICFTRTGNAIYSQPFIYYGYISEMSNFVIRDFF